MSKQKGGQPFNVNAEKWTESEALNIGNGLLDWLNIDNDDHIFFQEYLVDKHGLYEELISYLSGKYDSFLKLIKRCKKKQESKIVRYALKNKVNVTMAIFLLKNHHAYKDKTEQDVKMDTNIKHDSLIDRIKLSSEE